MSEWADLCPGCFVSKKSASGCSHCGLSAAQKHPALALGPYVLLNNQYVVGRVLGKIGGFGITYLGWDTRLEARVAIKEYLPRDLAGREANRKTVAPHPEVTGSPDSCGKPATELIDAFELLL